MAKRKPGSRRLGSAEDQHTRELHTARNAVRSATQTANTKLTANDCSRADDALRRATYFEGVAATHFDASMPYVAAGGFRDSTEARELSEATKRFRAACVRDRIKKA